MMYDGALRQMEAGKHAMANRDLEKQNACLQRAQRIVLELIACLDMEKGGEIAQNLLSLYSFVVDQLVQANMRDEPEIIDQCIQVLSELREGWQSLDDALHASPPDIAKAA